MILAAIVTGYVFLLAGFLVFLYAASRVSEDPEQDRWEEEVLAQRRRWRRAS